MLRLKKLRATPRQHDSPGSCIRKFMRHPGLQKAVPRVNSQEEMKMANNSGGPWFPMLMGSVMLGAMFGYWIGSETLGIIAMVVIFIALASVQSGN